MTNKFDLSLEFAEIASLVSPAFNGRFGRLDGLASWLVATGAPMRHSIDRELILFCEDRFDEGALPQPTRIKISRHLQSDSADPSVANSIKLGIEIADRAIDGGVTLLFLSSLSERVRDDLEILVGALTRTDAASVASRGKISDLEWMENVIHIRDETFLLRDHIGDPSALLAQTRSFDIAAMVGVILQSAKRATPVMLIGDAASCAALIATRISHRSRTWTIPAVDLISPVGALTQRHLDRPPILELGMAFDRDYQTPIAMTVPIIDAVLALLTT
jgi:hypothetical protein